MNKIITILVAFFATLTVAKAQPSGHNSMTFVGKSLFYVTMMGNKAGETIQPSDTILYSGTDFTLPSMKYGDMIIPSFTITGTTFSGGYDGVVWDDQTFTSSVIDSEGAEKTITGTSLTGSFTHDGGIYKVQLNVTFKYGTMPFPITYTIESYYVKDYTGVNSVVVGTAPSSFGPYTADVTYKIRTYVEDEVTKLDVQVPYYELPDTYIGNLKIGTYTVCGLAMDAEKGGYYKDYSSDALQMHFTASSKGVVSFDNDYELFASGFNDILVSFNGSKVVITNHFKPGVMPFPITAVMDQTQTTAITSVSSQVSAEAPIYNVSGQRATSNSRGILIRGGKKYLR